jgi:hypothetical protein
VASGQTATSVQLSGTRCSPRLPVPTTPSDVVSLAEETLTMDSQVRHGGSVHEKPNRHILQSVVRIALAVGAVLVVLMPALLR